jgi:RHS repeat-associated protein
MLDGDWSSDVCSSDLQVEAHDFKGNLRASHRRLALEYRQTVDWAGVDAALPPGATDGFDIPALEQALAPLIDPQRHASATTYDALNRPLTLRTPDQSLTRHRYDEANLLDGIDVNLQGQLDPSGQPVWTPFVTRIERDAKGQRLSIAYGNGATTDYRYDPRTFRLTHLRTRRNPADFPADDPDLSSGGRPPRLLQNLSYAYDPAGNITHIQDDAQQTLFFCGAVVEPHNDYVYDALYRLIQATGREHLGQGGAPIPHSYNDAGRCGAFPPIARACGPNDVNAMGRYVERYVYDAVGNFLQMAHERPNAPNTLVTGWTRRYAYQEASLLDSAQVSNRLSRTTVDPAFPEDYGHDTHGNMTRMPHLQEMQWDYRDQLRLTRRQRVNAADEEGGLVDGERTWYVYDASGQRVRKVCEKKAGLVEERIYLGGFEIYRKHKGPIGADSVKLERETLHVMDDRQRIALVETRTKDTTGDDEAPRQLIRFQLANHLGSASIELDELARMFSHEEYAPYGSPTYQAVRSLTETTSQNRYTGKERDKESGLYYHGARLYTAWLGRWISVDPLGVTEGVDLFIYANDNPISYIDPDGRSDRNISKMINSLIPEKPELNNLWPYDEPVPERTSLGTDVQREHPIPVSVREEQRTAPNGTKHHSRKTSARKGQPTILLETGKATATEAAKPHTQVKQSQMELLDDVRAKKPISEGEIVERTKKAYAKINENLQKQGKLPIDEKVIDTAILADQATIHVDTADTAKELRTLGFNSGDLDSTIDNLDDAFPNLPKVESLPTNGKMQALRDGVTELTEKALKSKAGKVISVVAPILVSGAAKAAPGIGLALGVADVASEASQGNGRRAILSGIGTSEIPIASQAADIGLAIEDAGWAAKEVLDPEHKLEMWYYNTFLK